MATHPNEARKNLYSAMVSKGYKGSLDEFEQMYSEPNNLKNLHRAMSENYGYEGDVNSFANMYFADIIKKKIQASSQGSRASSSGSPTSEPLPEGVVGPEQIPFPEPTAGEPTAEPTTKPEAEVEKTRNPIKSFFKSAWNTAFYDIPAAMTSAVSALTPDNPMEAGFGFSQARASQRHLNDTREFDQQLESGVKEVRSELLNWAMERSGEGAASSQDLIKSWDDVHDFIDMLNFASAAVGQAGVQIPATVATGGASSIGQAIGGIYMDEVRMIAEEKGITPEEVIDQGLDDRATAIAFGVASGMIDKLGADKVMGGITKKFVGNSLRSRAKKFLAATGGSMLVEGLTEGTQSIIEQTGASVGADQDVNIDIGQVRDEALAGALGGGGVTTIGQAISTLSKTKQGDAVSQTKGETQRQDQPAAAPEVEPVAKEQLAEEQVSEEEQRTPDQILDSEDDVTVLKESFIANRKSDDAEADFDEWIQTLPEAEKEAAAIRQEEIILTGKLRDIQAQEAENQSVNTEDTADIGTGQEATAQGNELPNNVLTSENEQQITANEEAIPATDEAQVQREQSQPAQVEVATEITGEVFQPGVDENVRQEAFTKLEQAGIRPEEAQRKIEAAKKIGVNVRFHTDEGSLSSYTGGYEFFGFTEEVSPGQVNVEVGLYSDNPSKTLDHELAHAVFLKVLGDNKQSAPRKRIRSVIESSLQIEAQDNAKLQEFLSRYPKSERTDEFLAESLALLASGKVKLKQSVLEKVVTAVKELASKILGTPIQYNVDNDADVRRMFKALAGAISGKTGQDLNNIISNVVSKAYPDINQVEQYVAKYMPDSVKNNPEFENAVKFIQQNDALHSDQAIAKVVTQQLGFSPMEVTELFEAALNRKYRGLNPIHQTQNAKYEYLKLFGMFRKFKEAAYRADYHIRNAGTFLRNQVVDIERRLGITLPANLNPYEAFQLWKPKAAYTEKTVNDAFFGDDTKQGKKNSFLGRLNAAGVSTTEFNDFMIAQHGPERYERVVEMWEDNVRNTLRKIDKDLHKAGNEDAKSFLPDIKRFPITATILQKARGLTDSVPHLKTKLENNISQMEKAYAKVNEMVEFQQQVYGKMGPKKVDTARRFFTEFQSDYLNKFVQVLEDGGMIDEKRANFLRNGVSEGSDVVWQSYVPLLIKDEVYADENGEFHDPLGRDFDSLAANVYNNGIHGITGNTDFTPTDLKRPLDVAYHRLINAVKAVEYNNAMRTLADFVQSYGNPQRVRVVKSRAVPKVNEFGEVEGVDDYTPEIVKNKGHAYRMPNGKLAYIYFTDPNDGVRGILTSNRYQPDAVAQWFIDAARSMNNFYRALLITYNPSFMVGNPFRDAQEAFANIKSEYNVKGIRRELAKRMGMSLAFFTSERAPVISRLTTPATEQEGAMKEMADYWDEAQRMGVRMSWAMVNEPATTESIQKKIDEVEAAVLNRNASAAKRAAKSVHNFFSGAADVSENIVRLAAYSALRNKGVPAQKAAYIARNITIDFEKRGASKFMNSFVTPLYLFLNVGIQGAGRGMKLFTTKGGRSALAAMAGIYALNRILLYELSGMIGGDDEEEFKSNYLNNDFIRRNYSLIFNPFDPKNPIRLPKPYSPVRMISSLSENVVDKIYGTRTVGDAVMDMFQDGTTIIDPVSGGSGSWPSYLPFALLHPVIEAGVANQDWMGNPILRARDKGIDAYTYNNSTEAAKFNLGPVQVPIGKAYVKAAGGAYDYTNGLIDVSPTTLEYLTNAYLLKNPPVRAMGNVEDAITEYVQDGDELKLAKGVTGGLGGRKLYDPLDEKEKQVLFNFFDIADRSRARGLNDEQFDQMKKALRIIRKKELADSRTINAWLETMKLKFPEYETKIERLK